MSLEINDWLDFCKGRKQFDKGHFYTLFMDNDDGIEINQEAFVRIFSFFKHSESLKSRLESYFADVNYRSHIENIEKHLVYSVTLDIRQKQSIVKDEALKDILNKPVKYIDEIDTIEMHQDSYLHQGFLNSIEEYLFDHGAKFDFKTYALFDAYYGLAHDFQLVWYLGSPLYEVEVNFDNYFDVWKVGGDYAVTENGVIISQYTL